MHRVVEALQCNMWDNMVRKPMNFGTAAHKKENTNDIQKIQDDENEEDKVIDDDENEQNQEVEKDKIAELNKELTGSDQKLDSNSDAYKPGPVFLDPLNPLLPIPDYAKSDIPPANEFENEERNLEELGQLMAQMKDLKDNIKNMSIDQRRTNAEEMIKKIAGFMNISDEIFSSDEEDNIDYDQLVEDPAEPGTEKTVVEEPSTTPE